MHILKVAVVAQPAACAFKVGQQGGFTHAPADGTVFFQCALIVQALNGGKNGKRPWVLPWFPQVAVYTAAVADVPVVIEGKSGKAQFWHTDGMRKGNKIGAARAYLRVWALDFLGNSSNVSRIGSHIHSTASKGKAGHNNMVRVAAGLQGSFFKNKFPNKLGAE